MSTPHLSMHKLQAADKFLGRFACLALKPFRRLRQRVPKEVAPKDILLIKFWGIGSLQLLTPALNSIRKRYPEAQLTLLTLRGNQEFARGLGVFDVIETLDVEGCGWMRMFGRILHLFSMLRRARFDRVYDFEFLTRFSAIVSFATGAPVVRGFDAPAVDRGGFHTERVPFNRYWHVARNFRALAEGETGVDVEASEVVAYPVELLDEQRVRELLSQRGIQGGVPYVVFNVNAGELSLERRWPAANFVDLIRRSITEDGTRIVLIGSPGEARYTGEIVKAAGSLPAGFLVDLSGALSIGQAIALLRGATSVVSNDSGPMHIAAALGTPTIGLFGPETPLMYAPLGPRARALWDPPVCSPCINVHDNKVATCIHGQAECLVNISVERVLEELRFMMSGTVLRPIAKPAAVRTVNETGDANRVPAE